MNAQAYAPSDADLSFDSKPEVQEMRDWKRNQFKGWARLAVAWAADLAPYQSPTFRAISISHAHFNGHCAPHPPHTRSNASSGTSINVAGGRPGEHLSRLVALSRQAGRLQI
jgi:hypothetical protein